MRIVVAFLGIALTFALAGCQGVPKSDDVQDVPKTDEAAIKAIGEKWRRGGNGWNNDMPQHLTVDKIEGGIL